MTNENWRGNFWKRDRKMYINVYVILLNTLNTLNPLNRAIRSVNFDDIDISLISNNVRETISLGS